METYKEIEHKGYTIKIYPDTDAESPGSWGDEEVFLIGFDSRNFWVQVAGYTQGLIENALRGGRYEDGSRDSEAARLKKDYWMFELDAYIHSGVALRLGKSQGAYHKQGFVEPLGVLASDDAETAARFGIVLIKKEHARTKAEANKRALGLINTWNEYLAGDVYGYQIETPKGEEIGSCWGFYGDDGIKRLTEDAIAEIDAHKAADEKDRAEVVDMIERGEAQIYDTGAKGPVDRYTIIHGSEAYGMSDNAQSPQGFNQYIGESSKLHIPALGKKVKFKSLPLGVREAIIDRLKLQK